jgi:replicative DNA helicase
MITESLFENIYRGKKGLNKGLSTGFPKLDNVIFGLQRAYFYTIGADQGAGKSSLALYCFVYQPLKEAYINNLNAHFLYYSFEMSAEVLFAKLLSLHLFEKYKVIVSYDEILSLKNTISDENLKLIEQEKSWLLFLESKLTVIDKPVNANGLYATCKEWIKNHGEFKEIDEHKESFTPNDPNQYLIVLVDHIRLLKNDGNVKSQIDQACDYLIYFRNKCKITAVVVQQLNRGFKSMARRQDGVYQLVQMDDFSDSSAPTQSSEVVMAIFHPFREKMSKCEGYNVRELQDRMRLIQILKNRFGQADKNLGVNFFGEVNYWRELPRPDEINNYQPFKQLI